MLSYNSYENCIIHVKLKNLLISPSIFPVFLVFFLYVILRESARNFTFFSITIDAFVIGATRVKHEEIDKSLLKTPVGFKE